MYKYYRIEYMIQRRKERGNKKEKITVIDTESLRISQFKKKMQQEKEKKTEVDGYNVKEKK